MTHTRELGPVLGTNLIFINLTFTWPELRRPYGLCILWRVCTTTYLRTLRFVSYHIWGSDLFTFFLFFFIIEKKTNWRFTERCEGRTRVMSSLWNFLTWKLKVQGEERLATWSDEYTMEQKMYQVATQLKKCIKLQDSIFFLSKS